MRTAAAYRDGRLIGDIEKLDLRFVVVEVERIIVNLGRVGKIARNAVKHELYAFVHVSRTAEYADELFGERRFADGRSSSSMRSSTSPSRGTLRFFWRSMPPCSDA